MPISFDEAFKKDEFYQMPVEEQRKWLGQQNEAFAGLPEKEQNKVIGKRHLQYMQTPEYKRKHPEPQGFWGEFGSTLGSDAANVPVGIWHAVHHPIDTTVALGKRQWDEEVTAAKRFKEGRTSEAAGHALAGITPVVGPIAADIGEEMGEHPGRAAAHALELGVPELLKALPSRVKVPGTPIIENLNNPVEEKALQSLEPHVQMTPGQRTGNVPWQRREQTLESLPGSGSRAAKFYAEQPQDLAQRGRALAASTGAQPADAVGAGKAVQDRLRDRILKTKNQSDHLYDQVRQATAANKVTMQTGTKPVLNAAGKPLLGPTGQALTTAVTKTFETPVDIRPMQAGLKAIYDNLNENMPQVQREHSPAYTVLHNLITKPEPFMDAMDFDKFLGAVKALARDGKSPYLTSKSQRLAMQIVGDGEKQLDTALKTAGPKVNQTLRSARNTVKSYYRTAELQAEFAGEPAPLYKRLSAPGDRMLDHLTELQKIAPHEMQTVGRTFLEGMMEKATKEGGFGRAPGIMQDWNNMGPRTKNMIFGPKLTRDMDEFLLGAKRLTRNMNPSGSGHTVAVLTGFQVLTQTLRDIFTANPVGAMKTAGLGYMLPKVAAGLFFTPGGAKLMTDVMTLPVRTPAYKTAVTALGARVVKQAADLANKTTPDEPQRP